jgi:predicted dehydrogenase
VVALCDIDDERLGTKAGLFPKAATFFDYRQLLDKMAKELDAVMVSTPDHSHALPSLLAMQAGKHVYCQKPLAHTPAEVRLMREAAAKYKVCTQMGNQGSGLSGLRRAVELVRGGVIGDVTEAHVWTNRPFKYWKQSPDVVARPPESAVPKHVHWEEWIGPAPFRPFAVREDAKGKKAAYHPHDWRGYWDFGTGAIGDMACHTANMAFMGLKLDHPTKVSAEAGDVNPETCPSWAHVTMEFGKRGEMPPVTLHWYEGKKDGKKVLPSDALVAKALKVSGQAKLVDSGSILVGEKGIAYSPDDYGANVFFETGARTGNGTKPEKLPSNNGGDQGQKAEWIDAIKANKPTLALSNFDYAALLTEAFLLGNVAIRTGKPFQWDGPAFKATGNDEAMKYIKQEYRKGWDLIGEKA